MADTEKQPTIIVKGDYVQSKHVDYQIGDIAGGGIGVQIIGGKRLESEKDEENRPQNSATDSDPKPDPWLLLELWMKPDKDRTVEYNRQLELFRTNLMAFIRTNATPAQVKRFLLNKDGSVITLPRRRVNGTTTILWAEVLRALQALGFTYKDSAFYSAEV